LKKAKYKLNFAEQAKSRGQLVNARALAREALSFNPNYGKAYLLIGRLYQESVNECGNNEFEKRMVYAAALRQVQKAATVDQSISSVAAKYIASYRANLPDTKTIFTYGANEGSSYTIKCWINETVTIQSSVK
jgi:tetratricopeptide (TPR) repeat protein